jgi:hypothetical protein
MNGKKKKKNKIKDNVKLKDKRVSETVTYILVIAFPLAFLVGGFLLFFHINESKYTPDDEYIAAENLVKSKELIGLTFEECVEKIGRYGYESSDNRWVFTGGKRLLTKSGVSDLGEVIYYEIYISHKDGAAVKAVHREARS